jgi:hypothetical protein
MITPTNFLKLLEYHVKRVHDVTYLGETLMELPAIHCCSQNGQHSKYPTKKCLMSKRVVVVVVVVVHWWTICLKTLLHY